MPKKAKSTKPKTQKKAPSVKASVEPKKLKKSHIKTIALVVVAIAALYYLKGFFVVALVNGEPISRVAVVKELEKEQGKVALDWLVTKKLILQEAKKKNVTVTDEEVDKEMKTLQDTLTAQGQNLEQALAAQGMSVENYKDRLRIAKVIQKIFEKDVVVTEAEVNAFLEKNKDAIPEGSNPNVLKAQVKEQLKTQKIDEKGSELIQKLKKEASINYFHTY